MRDVQDIPAIEAKSLSIGYRRYLKKDITLKSAAISLFQGTHFKTFWALENLDLTLKKGERLGIIGPNGAGKSTLLKAIAGVLPPTKGTLKTRGRISPLLELGAGFRDDLTGIENIFLNGAIMGLSPSQMNERLDRIIDFADIGDFVNAPLVTYSSGMRARLGFAVATDVDPDILLLDEVLSVGDVAFQAKAMARMDKLFDSDKTVVVVSHSMEHVRRLCDYVIYLEKGAVAKQGPTEEVIKQYLADYAGK